MSTVDCRRRPPKTFFFLPLLSVSSSSSPLFLCPTLPLPLFFRALGSTQECREGNYVETGTASLRHEYCIQREREKEEEEDPHGKIKTRRWVGCAYYDPSPPLFPSFL